jgi:nickel/cobalt transporter (NicO) family protein
VRRLGLGALAGLIVVLLWPSSPASAHPLGNFSVNQYEGLTLRPDRVEVAAVVDAAEIPTMQDRPTADANHDGMVDDPERAAYAATTCRDLAKAFSGRVGHDRLTWTVTAPSFEYVPGTTGLPTSRLSCGLSAPARLGSATTVSVENTFRTDRVGWREMTAVGDGVRLVDSPLPNHSVSNGLRAYPADLLSSQLDVRSATLRVAPGNSGGGGSAAATFAKPLGGDAATRWMAAADRRFQHLAAGRHLTPIVAILAILAAILLGAGHAALPGHGKTVLAAYLAGKQGRPRDALVVGATVTMTHTGGVLVIGLLLSTSSMLAGDRLLGYLGLVSGLLVTAVGVGMLVGALRKRQHHSHHHHDHDHDHSHTHTHDRPSRLSLAGIGLAGGLVPSPSALVVLLGAIGLGRAGFGVLLVLGYGLGMAGALIGAGLLLVVVQRRVAAAQNWSRLAQRFAPITARIPAVAATLTAGLVVIVGLGLAVRAATGVI